MSNITVQYDDLVRYGKFEKFGRGPIGFDCYGVVIEIMRRLGKDFPDFQSVCFNDVKSIDSKIKKYRSIVQKVERPQIGHIVLMRHILGHFVCHMGIMVIPDAFLHASRDNGIECVKIYHPAVRDQIEGFYAYQA